MKSSTVLRLTSARTLLVALGAVLIGAGHAARAQNAQNPDDQTAPPAAYGAARPDTNKAARVEARRTMVEQRMRDMMTRSGISTLATQDAILAFMREDEDEKRAVRDAGRNLWNGIRRDAPAERLRALLGDYQKALRDTHDSRVRAQTALDARVGYSLDARLESLLWLLGVLGEGQNTLVIPAPPRSQRRAIAGNALATDTGNGERQIEGIVNTKSAPDEATVWLEVRDAQGYLWRMVPSTEPDAQPILNRQIQGLTNGARVLVRVALSPGANTQTPLSLLAIVSAPNETQQTYGDEQGAEDAPDGQ